MKKTVTAFIALEKGSRLNSRTHAFTSMLLGCKSSIWGDNQTWNCDYVASVKKKAKRLSHLK